LVLERGFLPRQPCQHRRGLADRIEEHAMALRLGQFGKPSQCQRTRSKQVSNSYSGEAGKG
jgi:hypothetical protein